MNLSKVFNSKIYGFGSSILLGISAGTLAGMNRYWDTGLFPAPGGSLAVPVSTLFTMLGLAAVTGANFRYMKPVTTVAAFSAVLGSSYLFKLPAPISAPAESFAVGGLQQGILQMDEVEKPDAHPMENFQFGKDSSLTTTSSKPAPLILSPGRQPV